MPGKIRRVVLTEDVDAHLKDICIEIARRYEIQFVEIGTDHDHVHFLIQSVPNYSPTQIARIVKSITGRETFQRVPPVKKLLWGGEFWSKGFFINTVGQKGNDESIATYVRNQGRENEYQALHREQLTLFYPNYLAACCAVVHLLRRPRIGNLSFLSRLIAMDVDSTINSCFPGPESAGQSCMTLRYHMWFSQKCS
jgi:REP element-mobilizing transposase RayT